MGLSYERYVIIDRCLRNSSFKRKTYSLEQKRVQNLFDLNL